MRIIVLGGAGNFGARIVRALQGETGLELVSAGRRAMPVPDAPAARPVAIDIKAPDFAAQLAALAPDLVIHCVGPFQGQDYRVARAALAAGAHYLDLADGRDFVTGFADANDVAAKSAGRSAISGASTLPALSSAVVDHLGRDLDSLESIATVIAPGQRAPRGAATLAAVFSYLGRAVPVWHGGRWQTAWGWMDLRRVRFGFGGRWGALCDVPDLALLPQRYRGVQSVLFHAALEIRAQHLVLWALAAARRWGVPLPVEQWSHGLERCAALLDPLGGEWGGMQVRVVGRSSAGSRVERTWELQAPASNGPQIPALAAIILARRLARGWVPPPGAYACMGFVPLEDFAPEFARWGIVTRVAGRAL